MNSLHDNIYYGRLFDYKQQYLKTFLLFIKLSSTILVNCVELSHAR
jgi:hypothetical protein